MRIKDIAKKTPDSTLIEVYDETKYLSCWHDQEMNCSECERGDNEFNCSNSYIATGKHVSFSGRCDALPLKLADKTVVGLDVENRKEGRFHKAYLLILTGIEYLDD